MCGKSESIKVAGTITRGSNDPVAFSTCQPRLGLWIWRKLIERNSNRSLNAALVGTIFKCSKHGNAQIEGIEYARRACDSFSKEYPLYRNYDSAQRIVTLYFLL